MRPRPGHRVGEPDPGPNAGAARSYDARGMRFTWTPPVDAAAAALDVERRGDPTPPALARRFNLTGDDFLRAWTATEVIAKLGGVPILEHLSAHGLTAPAPLAWFEAGPSLWLRRTETETHIVTVGLRANGAAMDAARPFGRLTATGLDGNALDFPHG